MLAKVVDECDSVNGCTVDQNYEPPCGPDAIMASPGVWDGLGVPETQRGELVVTGLMSCSASTKGVFFVFVFVIILYLMAKYWIF